MAKIQIQRELIGDNARVYHSRTPVVQETQIAYRGGIITTDGEVIGIAHTERGNDSAFIETLLEVPGIDQVQAYPYKVLVIRSPMYSWEEIEPHILRLFAAFNTTLGEYDV